MDDVFLIIAECESYCGCGGQCVSCIACHEMDTGEQNHEVDRTLQIAGVCNCIRKLQHDHIKHQNMIFP